MLEIKNLTVQIEDSRILDGLNLTVNKGEAAAIIGPDGSAGSMLSSAASARKSAS
jgi:Fe-S cluster assembly ATP-binding protein